MTTLLVLCAFGAFSWALGAGVGWVGRHIEN